MCLSISATYLDVGCSFPERIDGFGPEFIREHDLTSENSTSTPVAQFLLTYKVSGTFPLAGTGITVAANQSGDFIYGRCKFESDEPWNGVIAGLLSGSSVSMAIEGMQGNVLVSTDITGTISDDVLRDDMLAMTAMEMKQWEGYGNED